MLTLLFCLVADNAHAQRKKKKTLKEISVYDVDTLIEPIPRNRGLWHNHIDGEQKKADVSDGAVDGVIYFSSEDTLVNLVITKAILKDVDHLQTMVENMPDRGRDPAVMNGEKIRALKSVEHLLVNFNNDYNKDPYAYRKRVNNLKEFIIARNEGRGMEFIKENVNVHTMNNIKELYEPETEERRFIFSEMGKLEPQMMIKRLNEFANESYADDVVKEAAKVVPNQVFNFASSTNYRLSNAVRRSKDPLVQTIVKIAEESKVPLKAMPFLNDIYTKRYTIRQIDSITANEDLFYQNLVRLKRENVQLGGDTYTDELQYRGLKYVREMNDLHEEKDPVRFKCIEKFDPYTLYFIMVYGQDEIYTSSFIGTFNRMMERMGGMTGDQLFDSVHNDKFRTFIRMCAGYNTLSRYLATMEPEKKNTVMKRFIAGLEQGKEDDLEDAVDVADAFGSLQDPELITFLQNEVRENYERSYKEAKSKKGVIIYGLLATLFSNAKETDSSDMAAERQSELLNIPPINKVLCKNVTDDSGVIYEQFFFYGDKDGKSSYANFLTNFKDGKWKKVDSKYWTTITSTTDKKIVVYANLPLPEPEDEDAQRELNKYLESKDIKPTIIIHRGHSYHLPITMEHMVKETKIVMLGSCGGYHNLGKVLDQSPDAHIISSKQVGAMNVNEPIIKAINDQLLAGKDIDWITTWKGLNSYFANKGKLKEMFNDYIPPHKNLGAIFIKAYRRMLHSTETAEEEG